MSQNKTFFLPDLGEGLPDATIVEWHVKVGDVIRLDENLVSMETAKAVVDVPSPVSGKVLKLAGGAGDVIVTGKMLAEFAVDPSLPQRAEGQDTGHHHGGGHHEETAPVTPPPQPSPASGGGSQTAPAAPQAEAARPDSGTVVGAMQSSDAIRSEAALAIGGVKAVPAVRALAKKLKIDLTRVQPTGAEGVITLADVKNAAASGHAAAAPSPQSLPHRGGGASAHPLPSAGEGAARSAAGEGAQRSTLSAAGKPMRTQPPTVAASGQPEQLKGVRRNMARVMASAHAQVVPTTIVDDADLHAWIGKQDITARLVRSIVAACKAVPALNAWFDGEKLSRTLHPHVDIGIAVDTDDGLFVPALRNADMLDGKGVRAAIGRLRAQVEDRSIAPSELSGYTISLSNFGMFAGRYASPVVVPPCVAIVGAGKLCHDVVAVMGGIEVHRRMPISLTFDHRACTGGEAARFLKALLDDLSAPH
ncbi:MAG: 2-oxo acid dehydrogenase subunit E2 [Proteobacteria bacterium]|nr:2-oxo acid dehydrogenase subunit E2 [Pseudomonadota bacterium]